MLFIEKLIIPFTIIVGGAIFIQILKKKPFLGAMPELLEKARRTQPLPVKLKKSYWPPILSVICLLLVFFASIALVELLQGTYYLLFFPGNDLVFVNNVAALVIQMLGLIICDLMLFDWFFQNVLIRRFAPNNYMYSAAEFMYRNKNGWTAILGGKPADYHVQLEKIFAEYDYEKFFVPMQQTYLRRRLILALVLVPIMIFSLVNYIAFGDEQIMVKDFWSFNPQQYVFNDVKNGKVTLEYNFKNGKAYPEPHFYVLFKDQRRVDLWQGIFFLSPSSEKLIAAYENLKNGGVSMEVGFLTPLTNLRASKRQEIEKVFNVINPSTVPVINYKKISDKTMQKVENINKELLERQNKINRELLQKIKNISPDK
ncbi:MAG: hypothetical protein WC890_03815 [Candidatus Margulisiibacteriota bacterium]